MLRAATRFSKEILADLKRRASNPGCRRAASGQAAGAGDAPKANSGETAFAVDDTQEQKPAWKYYQITIARLAVGS
jgi:hypothetical protein